MQTAMRCSRSGHGAGWLGQCPSCRGEYSHRPYKGKRSAENRTQIHHRAHLLSSTSLTGCPELNYATLTSMAFGLAFSDFGTCKVNTPSLNSALTLLSST